MLVAAAETRELMYSRVCAQCATKGRYGAQPQNDPPRRTKPGGDRRRGRVSARRWSCRHADRDGLRPCGGRDLRCGDRGDIRRQGPARDQPAHRSCFGHQGGAGTRHLRPRGGDARPRILAWASHSGPARGFDLKDQSAGARRTRHCGDPLAGARNRAGADRRGGRPSGGPLRQPVRRREPDDRFSCHSRPRWQGRLDP